MKRLVILACLFIAFTTACAPVLTQRTMDQGSTIVPLADMQQRPDLYRAKLFIFGGTIASAKTTIAGSLLELAYSSVNSRGALQDSLSGTRVLVFMPKERGLLDPVIFAKGRKVTVAGAFDGIQMGKIEEMDYAYPFFRIHEIYLWPHEVDRPSDYYYPYYPSFWWGPSWGIGIGTIWR
ncbi:MAG TPA: Slp family lipoprotein [Dissulfurispiraceae bacterium]|nr:Slp family lipoprotein [Dissulfurispiraceae bacterium]